MVLNLLIYIILIIIAIIVIFWLLGFPFFVLPNADGCEVACLQYHMINETKVPLP
jgi:hypothetical protein